MTFKESIAQQQIANDLIDAHLGGDTTNLMTATQPFVRQNEIWADLSIQAGVDNTGVIECSAAINTALTAAVALGLRVYGRGTYKISSTVTIVGSVDFGDATFNYNGVASGTDLPGTANFIQDGVAVSIGTPSAVSSGLRVVLPTVINTNKTILGWSQVLYSKGIAVINCDHCDITITRVNNFNYGIIVAGSVIAGAGKGTQMTDFRGPIALDNNLINFACAPVNGVGTADSGWTNQCRMWGGKMSHNSAEGSVVSGCRHILMNKGSKNIIDGWLFSATDLESADVVEYHIEQEAQYLILLGCRFENTGGFAHRKLWNRGVAKNNLILFGFNSGQLNQVNEVGVEQFEVWSEVNINVLSSITVENQTSSALALFTGMPAGAAIAGSDPATAYGIAISANQYTGKRTGDSFGRVQLDHQNGQIEFGQGAAAPTVTLGALNISGTQMLDLEGQATTTSASTGGATALPALPTGYLNVVLNGGVRKIPYYQ
jgi:hypothetical protein